MKRYRKGGREGERVVSDGYEIKGEKKRERKKKKKTLPKKVCYCTQSRKIKKQPPPALVTERRHGTSTVPLESP